MLRRHQTHCPIIYFGCNITFDGCLRRLFLSCRVVLEWTFQVCDQYDSPDFTAVSFDHIQMGQVGETEAQNMVLANINATIMASMACYSGNAT